MQPTSLCQLPDSIILGFWYPLSLLYSLLDQAGQNFTDTILSRTCVSPMNFLDGMGLTFLDKSPQGLFWINPFYLGFLLCGLRDNTIYLLRSSLVWPRGSARRTSLIIWKPFGTLWWFDLSKVLQNVHGHTLGFFSLLPGKTWKISK